MEQVLETRIKVHDIPDEGLKLEGFLLKSGIDVSDLDFYLASDIQLRGAITRTRLGCLVSGKFSGAWRLNCARCLEAFTFPVDTEFHVFLSFEPTDYPEDVVHLTKEELDTSELVGDVLDLAAIIREQMLLAIPMKPLCSEHCKGLCPQCGKNLNFGQCDCETRIVDPRLKILEQLLIEER